MAIGKWSAICATCVAAVIAAGLYVSSPFYAAWTLREAIRTADTETVRSMIHWPTVRSSLRQSIAIDQDLIDPASLPAGSAAPRRSLWQSVKRSIGSSMLDRFLDTYVTPEGLPKLYAARQRFAPSVFEQGEWTDRLRAFVARLRRAEFVDLTTVELEIEDPREAERRYVSRLELMSETAGYTWKLTSVQILRMPSLAGTSRVVASF